MPTKTQKKIRIIDVAEAAGVSKATAVFSLNDRYDISISEPTRQKVKDTAKQMGYKTNRIAQALSTGKTGMVNIVVPYTNDPFFARYIDNLQQLVSQARLTPIVSANYNEDENAEEFMDRLISWPCDAYILCYSKNLAAFLKSKLPGNDHPIVYIGEKMDDIDSVYSDNKPAISAALQHLLESKRQDITYVSDRKSLYYINDRYALYKSHMKKNGREPVELVTPKRTRNSAYETTLNHLANNKPPQAFSCYDDELAIGVQRAVQDAGYKVPQDVAVTGFDGMSECDFVTPRLTTALYPYQEMCQAAWDFLQARMNDPAREIQTAEFKSHLIIGGSTQMPDRKPCIN
ncbi:Catabolite control protein A [Pontiella desulfatans]|uniref:Catabolite control protein A n=1 Tax=Pontiella desulfatans TaxID=2750659 RepID=A0A6C2U162_PONDE|nr:LacI family DNA-binding transcriptional regulator [Pontiella desulfatans]VGO13116.1 Catabolite control protein A [Pontiella desulfatans]